jgi:hypothetical protein
MSFAAADSFASRTSSASRSSQISATTLLSSMMHPARLQSCRISAISSSSMDDTKSANTAQVQTQLSIMREADAAHSGFNSQRSVLPTHRDFPLDFGWHESIGETGQAATRRSDLVRITLSPGLWSVDPRQAAASGDVQ